MSPLGDNGYLWSLSYEVWFYFPIYVLGVASDRKIIEMSVILSFVLIAVIFIRLNFAYLFCWLIDAIAYFKMTYRPRSWNTFLATFLSTYSVIST